MFATLVRTLSLLGSLYAKLIDLQYTYDYVLLDLTEWLTRFFSQIRFQPRRQRARFLIALGCTPIGWRVASLDCKGNS